jgi:hypothetical protein
MRKIAILLLAFVSGAAYAGAFDSDAFDLDAFSDEAFSFEDGGVVVPDCTNSPTSQATCVASVEGAGFVASVVERCSNSVADGNVISTNPVASTPAEPGSTVNIRVSNGEMCSSAGGRSRMSIGISNGLN